jgi:hypothetical protein
MQLSLGAEGVDDAAGNDRNRPRAFVEAEVVAIGRGVGVLPDRRASGRLQRFDNFLGTNAMKQDDLAAGDDRTAEAGTDVFLPDLTGATRRPGVGERRAAVDAVPGRAKELRPVRGHGRGERQYSNDG